MACFVRVARKHPNEKDDPAPPANQHRYQLLKIQLSQLPMKPNKYILMSVMFMAAVMAVATSAWAQQINGTPGDPSTTLTIDGKQIPPPPMPFGGVIKQAATDSKPYCPPRVVPPKRAPNILLIMTDAQGYCVYSTFGGMIPTPAMDSLA